jgi:hypothetical protein
MNAVGETRRCPHCGQQVLASASICPGCQRRLRVDAGAHVGPERPAVCPLSVEGLIRHPGAGEGWEYTVVVEILDEQGAVVTRRVVGVGAVRPGETRRVALRVEVSLPEAGHHPNAE